MGGSKKLPQSTLLTINRSIMTEFSNDELDILYNLVRDEHDTAMCGDWDAVKPDISKFHLLMHKLLKLQQ